MHRWPKRIMRDGDHLDVNRMNADIIPVAENTFALDADSFADNCIVATKIGADAHMQTSYDEVAVDTTIVDGSFITAPVPSATTIPNTGDWVPLAASVEITCGAAILVVESSCQYVRQTFSSGTPYHTPDNGATASGVVIGVSCRGDAFPLSAAEDPLMRPPVPLRTVTQRDATNRTPGPVGPFQPPCGANGPELAPVYMCGMFIVPPGTHEIHMVGKRVAINEEWDSTDYVQVTQEQIFVDVIPLMPAASATLDGVSVPLFESEDTLTTAAMTTDRFTPLRAALNGVTSGMVKRGAFTRRHLFPSALFASSTHQVGSVGVSFGPITSVYPGYAGTITGWTLLGDGLGDNVQSSSIAMGTTKVRVKITAMIHILEVYGDTSGVSGTSLANVACGCIAETVSGVTTPIHISERYLNSYGAELGGHTREEFIMTLIAYRDFSDGSGGTRQWKVYGSAASQVIATDGRWTWRSGRIDVEVRHTFG